MLEAKVLTEPQVERLLQAHKETPTWPRSVLNEIFGRRVKKDENGKVVGTLNPYMRAFDTFYLPAKTLPNQEEGVHTTAGLFFFNSYLLVGSFGDKIKYVNYPVKMPQLDAIVTQAIEGVQLGKIKEEELERYFNKIYRIGFFTEIFNPAVNTAFLKPLPQVEKLKEELLEKYKTEIENGDASVYARKIEKPLLDLSKELLQKEDCWSIYGCENTPKFGTNYKNNMVTVGPLSDPVTKKFNIIKNSYNEGLDPADYPTHANKLINASFNRAVETQYGGAKTKFLFAAMQNSIAGPKNSDCGTELYLDVTLHKDTCKDYLYRFIKEKDKLICLDPETIVKYLDRPLKMRSPLYCRSNNVCNKCLGDLFYILGIKNVGLTATRTTASVMQIAMKSMHDVTVKTTELNPYNFMTWIDK